MPVVGRNEGPGGSPGRDTSGSSVATQLQTQPAQSPGEISEPGRPASNPAPGAPAPDEGSAPTLALPPAQPDTDFPTLREADASAATALPLERVPEPAPKRSLHAGERLGRYLLVRRLGAGGMGEVYLAYDAELDRRVALKVLHAMITGDEAAARLRREAQALARLNHPNVVQIHEVGDYAGRLFVVMEYVEGADLRAWLRKRGLVGRPANRGEMTTIVDLMLQAGRGLAAAHRSGLAHRDVKPDNIFIGDDGRVRVGDFGLARTGAGEGQGGGPHSGAETSSGASVLSVDITRAGRAAGTPAYMAPEQQLGDFDARSDLFAYAVTFWEAVMGERPYAGSKDVLARRIASGEHRPPAAGHRAPRWLIAALGRALDPNPDARWPTMDQLLSELEAAPRRRWRWLLVGGVTLAVATISGALYSAEVAMDRRCTGAMDQLAGVWDRERRAGVEGAIAGIKVSYAPRLWARVGPALDGYAESWAEMHREICVATNVRQEQSSAVMDLRMACLSRARQELLAAVDVLETADAELLPQAHRVVGDLPPLSRCADVEALQAAIEAPDADEVAGVERTRAALSTARASHRGARYEAAMAAVEEASREAEPLTYAPLNAEILLERGRVLDRLGRYDEADEAQRQAIREGGRAQQWELVGAAATAQIGLVGTLQGRSAAALRYREIAEAAIGDDNLAAGHLAATIALLLDNDGRFPEAEVEYQRALQLLKAELGESDVAVANAMLGYADVLQLTERFDESSAMLDRAMAIVEEQLGPEHPQLAQVLNVLGMLNAARGEPEEAKANHRRALEIREASLGKEHPKTRDSANNLAVVHSRTGDVGEAIRLYEENLEIFDRIYDETHPVVGGTLMNLANEKCRIGRCDEAPPLYERALEIGEASYKEAHPDVGAVHINLASSLLVTGDFAAAKEHAERSLEIYEEVFGAHHHRVAGALTMIGMVYLDQGELREAETYLKRGHAMHEETVGLDHPRLVDGLLALGELARKRSQIDDAIALAERAVRISEAVNLREAARGRFEVAKAVAMRPRERARAQALARGAREVFAGLGEEGAAKLAEIDLWLAAER